MGGRHMRFRWTAIQALSWQLLLCSGSHAHGLMQYASGVAHQVYDGLLDEGLFVRDQPVQCLP